MKGLFIFAAGVVAGAVAGIYLAKDKIMADAKQEIEEVREYYKNKERKNKEANDNETVKNEPKELNDKVEEAMKELGKEISKRYTNYNNIENVENIQITEHYDEPYIIDIDEFGMNEEYDTMCLTYFADGVLVDDSDEVVEDPDVVVGLDNLKIFEEFGASAVYVRNEVWKTDFEILKDDWNWADLQETEKKMYEEMIEKKPHQL